MIKRGFTQMTRIFFTVHPLTQVSKKIRVICVNPRDNCSQKAHKIKILTH
ncbi:hypothetical protein SAMN04487935_1876 [Flavobacterium noncentrifugens]|uniref:Uncharacterized protein n=1 Tax=Flavobacterium noncentrifugens TaxID=1128970 RepID=A0A1G8WP19_9FLAO|nr:hypothetical protein SAMN04487935_1876 [Flavobacterium noncentrifugens]